MKLPIPAHAERITVNGDTAWAWSTQLGWSVLQGPYQIDLENCDQDGKQWHTIDWFNKPHLAGGLARYEPGHMNREEFLEIVERLVAALRKEERRGIPDLDQIRRVKGKDIESS